MKDDSLLMLEDENHKMSNEDRRRLSVETEGFICTAFQVKLNSSTANKTVRCERTSPKQDVCG